VVPKKSGVTMVQNNDDELISTRQAMGWRVCIDYKKLNSDTRKDHFFLPFIDQILKKLAGQNLYCFLDGYSGYNQIQNLYCILRTKRKPLSHDLLVHSPVGGYPLGYVMHLPHFKDS